MKKIKNGFSLAEVLIAMAIISVIATMGFTITKNSIARAYDMYIYTGYKGISDAIADAEANDFGLKDGTISSNFKTHIINLLDAKEEGGYIKAPNGVWYKFGTIGSLTTTDTPPQKFYYYFLEMKTPAKKKVVGNTITTKETTCFAYMPEREYKILVPFEGTGTSCRPTIEKLYNRMDLLPFYIDDGFVGRYAPSSSGAMSYHPKVYYSSLEATCRAYGQILILNHSTPPCPSGSSKAQPGTVRPENPRKAF